MTARRLLRLSAEWHGGMLTAALCASLITAAAAQKPISPEENAKLAEPLALAAGRTTMRDLMAELSRKTGLRITCGAYLNDRLVTVQMPRASAREVLDALSEMYDWGWYRTDDGNYVLLRHVLPVPHDIAGLARALPGALPVELRRYLGVGMAPKDRLPPLPPGARPRWDYHGNVVLQLAQELLPAHEALVRDMQRRLFDDLGPTLEVDERRPWSRLTVGQQTTAIWILLGQAITDSDFQLLHGVLLPFEASPDENRIIYNPKSETLGIMHRERLPNGGVNEDGIFGTGIRFAAPGRNAAVAGRA